MQVKDLHGPCLCNRKERIGKYMYDRGGETLLVARTT